MTKQTEALKQALEALELEDMACRYEKDTTPAHIATAITAIREALAEESSGTEQPVQQLPFGVGGGLVAIKTLLSRDPCVHANTAIEMIDAILAEQPAQQQEPVAWMHPDGRIWTFGRGLDKSTFTIPLYTSPPASKPCKGIPRKGCNYLTACDTVCNKCGEIHHHHQMVANFFAPASQPAQQQEPVAWISVKDALPKAVRGVSYKASLTDVVLVRHSDRPDYPITAHAVVGEGLGAGVAIPTEGASEHPEIAWYSQCRDLNNPFGLKNDDYGRYLPRVFGSKITHWKPIDTSPSTLSLAQRQSRSDVKPLTDEQIMEMYNEPRSDAEMIAFARAIEAKLKEKNSD